MIKKKDWTFRIFLVLLHSQIFLFLRRRDLLNPGKEVITHLIYLLQRQWTLTDLEIRTQIIGNLENFILGLDMCEPRSKVKYKWLNQLLQDRTRSFNFKMTKI